MQDDVSMPTGNKPMGKKIAMILAFILVVVGMVNTLPEIYGLQDGLRELTGIKFLRISGFTTEYFYPPIFFLMMLIVALDASMYREFKAAQKNRYIGLAMDFGLILGAFLGAFGYLVEIDSICLIDQFTGVREQLIQEALERSAGVIPGISFEAEVPACQARFGIWILPLLFTIITLFFIYNARVWGLPLVLVACSVVAYTVGTSLIWIFDLSDNNFLLTKLGADGGDVAAAAIQKATNVFTTPDGFMGRFMEIVVSQVFPYVILGSLFGSCAGGTALIKVAVRWTRHLRGGPAHAAIVSSAMFGTITGGPVTNVLSTGRLTIPMMKRSGFKPEFAGGVEAAASSGGQIMPPVMGVAAFVLVALTAVPYNKVIIAAFIPAICFFFSIFLAVMFQSRRDNIQAVGTVPSDLEMTRQDWVNLSIIVVPILVILVLLLATKDMISMPFLGRAINQTLMNSTGDAVSAGWWAVIVLIPMLFLDPETRKAPSKILESISDGGLLVSRLFLLLFAVSIIAAFLNESGLNGELTRAVTSWLETAKMINLFGYQVEIVGGVYLMLALACTMLCAILLGMGMPTVPAYVNVAILLGPLLTELGISMFTAHMFVFYFAVASAITPPVAVAAFAAASVANTEPMRTGVSAVRVGIVMFVIPFVFAWYPELLLIEEAVTITNDAGQRVLMDGYSGRVEYIHLLKLCLRLAFSLYLLASALTRFDSSNMAKWEIVLRLVAAILILWKTDVGMWTGIALGVSLIILHRFSNRNLRTA